MKILRVAGGCLILVAAFGFVACSVESSDGYPEEPTGEMTEAFMPLPPGLVVTIPALNEVDCEKKAPDGHRPLCANTSWDEGLLECTIIGFNSGCLCYEGRTRPCLFSNPDQWCSPSSATCGVKSCVVTSDTSSTWAACLPVP